MQLGMANQALNAPRPGSQQLQRNIFTSGQSTFNNAAKYATDASQLIGVGAGIQGNTDQALSNFQLGDEDWEKFGLQNLNQAYGAMTEEDRFKYGADQQKFQNEVSLKAAQAANKMAKRKALWNTIGGIAQIGVGAFTGNIGGIASGAGQLLGGGGAAGAGASAGAAVGAALPSDIRLKENYFIIGKSPSGINIYEFSYKGDKKRFIGVMAQEVKNATINVNGYLFVDYSKTDVEFKEI